LDLVPAELAFGRLPDPVVVNHAVTVNEAPFLIELMGSALDVLPAVVACFKNALVREVFRHLLLVPSLADDHKAVRGSIVV
jgi:hypothetical protein